MIIGAGLKLVNIDWSVFVNLDLCIRTLLVDFVAEKGFAW